MNELEGYKDEARRCREEEHKTKAAAQAMQRKLLDRIEALEADLVTWKSKYTELSTQYTELARKEHGWPWALEQLAAGRKVTHPILQGGGDMRGWIETIGEGPRGIIYEIHESYGYSRTLGNESKWQEIESKARQSIGWRVLP